MREPLRQSIRAAVRAEGRRGATARRQHDCVCAHLSLRPFHAKTAVVCKFLHMRIEHNVDFEPFCLAAEEIGDGGGLFRRGIYTAARIAQEDAAHALEERHGIVRAEAGKGVAHAVGTVGKIMFLTHRGIGHVALSVSRCRKFPPHPRTAFQHRDGKALSAQHDGARQPCRSAADDTNFHHNTILP